MENRSEKNQDLTSEASDYKSTTGIYITLEDYAELLTYKGKYEELKDICNNKLTSPILRPDAMPLQHPFVPGVRGSGITYDQGHVGIKQMEENNENHIPGVN